MGEAIAPQSDLAVFNMLDYNFKDKGYVGRGVIESISSDIDFRDGGLAVVLANIGKLSLPTWVTLPDRSVSI